MRGRISILGCIVGVIFTGTLAWACVGDDPGTTPDEAGVSEAGSFDARPIENDASDSATGPGVEGTVLDQGATPVANAKVRIGQATVQTDATGHFNIPNVNVPYDVDVVTPIEPTRDGTTTVVTSVRGLTNRTPFLHVGYVGPLRKATQSGSVSGASITFPLPADHHVQALFANQTAAGYGDTSPAIHDSDLALGGSYNTEAIWLGKPSVQGTWYLLYYQADNQGTPISYKGYARGIASVTEKTAGTVSASTLSDVSSTVTVNGSATFPANATQKTLTFGLKLDPSDRVGTTFLSLPSGDGAFSRALPSIPNAKALVKGIALTPNANGGTIASQHVVWKTNLATNATGVAIAFATAPSITSPAHNAAFKIGDTFKWTGGTAPYEIFVSCAGYRASLHTMATEATLPASLGTFPSTGGCTASVSSYSNRKNVDAVVDADAVYKYTSEWVADGTYTTTTVSFNAAQ